MRTNEPDLKVWIICDLSKNILAGHCTCMAGLGESCSHVAALLFFCEYLSQKNNETSVTDQTCYWLDPNSSKKIKITARELSEISYVNVKSLYKNTMKKTSSLKVNKKFFPNKPIADQESLAEFLGKVKESTPRCMSLAIVSPFCTQTDPREEFPFIFSNLYREEYSTKPLDELVKIGRYLFFYFLIHKQ